MKVTLTDRRKGDRDVSVVVENGGEPRRSVNERHTDTRRLSLFFEEGDLPDCPPCEPPRIGGVRCTTFSSSPAKAPAADTSCARFTPPAKTTRANPGQQWVSMTVDDLAALISGYRHGHRVEPEIA